MKPIVFLVSLLLLPGSMKVFKRGWLFLVKTPFLWHWILLGFAIGTILYFLVLRYARKWKTFEHEFTHAFVALLFFRRIDRFVVTGSEGGYVQHSAGFGGEFGDHLIGLAPYFLPTFSFIFALIYPFTPLKWLSWLLLLIGLTLAYHTFSTINETIQNWNKETFRQARTGKWVLSDIGRRGYIFSGLIIFVFTLLTHSIIFWLIKYGYHSLSLWVKIIWDSGIEYSLNAIGIIASLSTKIANFINNIVMNLNL